MKSSHFHQFLLFLILVAFLMTAPVSAAKDSAPDPWSPYQVYYQPYNSSISQNITIQNSTYIVDESGLVPVEWFVMFFCFAAVFLLAALFVEQANDITPVISAVLYYMLAYQGAFLSYHNVTPIFNSAQSEIYLVPYTEIFHPVFVSWFCLALAILMTVLAFARVLRELADMFQRKPTSGRFVDIILGK